MKVVNKQVVYEAEQFTVDENGINHMTVGGVFGEQTVHTGDWIIETKKGLLVLSDERFNELYELVETPVDAVEVETDVVKPKQRERGMSTASIHTS